MKKTLFGLLLSVVAIGGYSTVNAGYDTSCWSEFGTVPTSSYASGIIYGCDGDIPVVSIHNENGSGIIIKAMNEGTGTVKVKIGSGNDAASFGSHYQWGNSYPFPLEGEIMSGNYKTDASGYGPKTTSGYYESGVFLKGNSTRSSVRNDNLRGGTGDYGTNNNGIYNGAFWGFDTGNFTVTNVTDRKVMCPDGYHVPSQGEWNALLYLWGKNYDSRQETNISDSWSLSSLNYNYSLGGTGNRFSQDLLIPFAGRRNYSDGKVYDTGDRAYYWSSSPYDNAYNARYFNFDAYSLNADKNYDRANAFSVRCFKNSYIELPQTFTLTFDADANGGITTTGSVEVDGSVDLSGYVATKTGWDFLGWNTNSGATVPISTSYNAYTITENTTVYAIFKKDLKVTYLSGVGVASIGADSGSCAIYNTGTQCTVTAPDINLKDGYGTGIWSTGSINVNTGADITLTADDTYTANATPNMYIVKFDAGEGAGTMEDQTFTYDVAQNLTGNTFTRDGYTFSGWTDGITAYTDKQNVVNLATSGTITLTAQWKQNTPSGGSSTGGGSSGGGGSRKASSTNDRDSQTGNETDSSTNASNSEENTQDSANASEGHNQGKTYSDEMKKAYEFAYKHGITTMDSIEKADMEGPLTRIAMAKMLSQYAMNVLGQKPANIIVPKFKDVSDELDAQYDYGVSLAYQLGIMGINMKNNRFRPNDLVTRGEFATALSRMLYKIADGTDKYYSTHLAKLMEEKIITNDDPMMKELRGYVMIMLMRSAEDKNTEN